jgi:glycosyltransferase involved in cell wall biosynthesis
LQKIKPEIVQSHHFFANIYAAISAVFVRAVSIGASRSELKREIRINGIYGQAGLILPRYFVTNSKQSLEQAIQMGRNKNAVFYLQNSLDTGKYSGFKEIKPKAVILLAMGRLIPEKRFDRFIRLIADLKKTNGEIKGILVGSGKLEKNLIQLASELQLDSRNFEFVPETTMPEVFINMADIFVMTSAIEGTPNVVLEAMASGVPVISSKIGNLQFFMTDRHNCIFFDNDETLPRLAAELISDENLRITLSQNARMTINNQFSLAALEKNLIKFYGTISTKNRMK